MAYSNDRQNKPFPKPEERLRPGEYGGESKKSNDPKALFDLSFQSRTPPVVFPESIIVAVCGVPPQCSHPKGDAFILSDFYLMHRLCKGSTNEQYWLTAVDPKSWVQKHTHLLHGYPRSRRKIVLDEQILPELDNVIVVPPEDLADRFLAYLEDAGKSTAGTRRQIVIMVFSHGQPETFAFSIGGSSTDVAKARRVRPINIEQALHKNNHDPQAVMINSACFGGGYALTTSGNMTALAGVDHEHQILSWHVSRNGRASGTRFMSAMAESMCRAELAYSDEFNEEESTSPTFAALTKSIHDVLINEIEDRETPEIPSFAAKDDDWSAEYRQRSGMPLATYQINYDSLRTAPPGELANGEAKSGSMPSEDIRLRVLEVTASLYLASKPGQDEISSNKRLHGACRALLDGSVPESEDIMSRREISRTLNYRLRMIALATRYKDELKIEYPNCEAIDSNEEWSRRSNARRAPFGQSSADHIRKIYGVVGEYHDRIFDVPEDLEGLAYSKPRYYLTVMFDECLFSIEDVRTALRQLIRRAVASAERHHKISSFRLRGNTEVKKNMYETLGGKRRRESDEHDPVEKGKRRA